MLSKSIKLFGSTGTINFFFEEEEEEDLLSMKYFLTIPLKLLLLLFVEVLDLASVVDATFFDWILVLGSWSVDEHGDGSDFGFGEMVGR